MNTYFGQTLIEQAAYWQEKWIKEECKKLPAKDSTSGRGSCVDDLKELFSKTVEGTPWCAQFVSVCYKTAREKLRLKGAGKLPYTQATSTMLSGAKNNGLVVDSTPRAGCVFYRSRNGGGHVGIVAAVNPDGMLITIEGNSDNQVKGRTYAKGKYDGWQFIHVEDEEEVSAAQYALREPAQTATYAIVIGGVITAGYFGVRAFRRYRMAKSSKPVMLKDGTMPVRPEVAAILAEHNLPIPMTVQKTLADRTLAGLFPNKTEVKP